MEFQTQWGEGLRPVAAAYFKSWVLIIINRDWGMPGQ
jgi:hypothetical protein